jgi:succinyl-CoA synthetase beta subunit
VSRFIADFADEILEVEINPLAVFAEGEGCLALDAVIVARENPKLLLDLH